MWRRSPVFDARRPLANRSLRYLPGVLKNYGPLKQRLGELDVVSRAQDAEDRETARLLYVALTRAECHSIMAFGDPVGRLNLLSASVDDELLQWDVPTATDGDSIAVNEAGTMQIAARRRTGDDGMAKTRILCRFVSMHIRSRLRTTTRSSTMANSRSNCRLRPSTPPRTSLPDRPAEDGVTPSSSTVHRQRGTFRRCQG
jgi:ATP-dependent exoDNAse (exonuclease V) beta subunit